MPCRQLQHINIQIHRTSFFSSWILRQNKKMCCPKQRNELLSFNYLFSFIFKRIKISSFVDNLFFECSILCFRLIWAEVFQHFFCVIEPKRSINWLKMNSMGLFENLHSLHVLGDSWNGRAFSISKYRLHHSCASILLVVLQKHHLNRLHRNDST